MTIRRWRANIGRRWLVGRKLEASDPWTIRGEETAEDDHDRLLSFCVVAGLEGDEISCCVRPLSGDEGFESGRVREAGPSEFVDGFAT